MFSIFVVGVLAIPVRFVLLANGISLSFDPKGNYDEAVPMLNMVTMLAVAGGVIWSLIYLPLRWNVIRRLPPQARVLGMVGGFGLMALEIAEIIYLLAYASSHS
jgi:hypothetical protein